MSVRPDAFDDLVHVEHERQVALSRASENAPSGLVTLDEKYIIAPHNEPMGT